LRAYDPGSPARSSARRSSSYRTLSKVPVSGAFSGGHAGCAGHARGRTDAAPTAAAAWSIVLRERVPPLSVVTGVSLNGRGDDALLLNAETVDGELHHIAGHEISRRLLAHADAGWRARRDDVTGQQRHEATDVAHEKAHVEHHVRRVSALLSFP